MENQLQSYSVSELCEIINVFSPSMDDYLYIYDLEKDFYYISSNAENRFALPSNQFYNAAATFAEFVHPDDYDVLLSEFEKLKSGTIKEHDFQYRMISKDKRAIWIHCRGIVHFDAEGHPEYLLGCLNEIGKKQEADNVSGLLGLKSLSNFIAEGFDTLSSFGFLLRLGIDDFKEINEKLGNDYGDLVLQQASSCIRQCLRPGQRLFRLTGDEFMVVDAEGHSKKHAVELYKDIRSTLEEFLNQSHFEAVFTISGGVLPIHPNQPYTFSEKMKFSEFSLSEAKHKGKNCSYIFNIDDYNSFLRRRKITQLLRKSLRQDFEGFKLYLQPLYDLRSEKIFGAESLLRFSCKELGDVPPTEIIPILEETGLIVPVGKWILHQALKMQKEIQKVIKDFHISINVSYVQIAKSNIISEIIEALELYDVDPSYVVIELTESGMLDSNMRVEKLWTRLRDKGIHLALDDFGTGYSNFHYLNELRPDIIKIDRSFTEQVLKDEYESHLLSLMSDMAQSLDIKMCIEGIEEAGEMDILSNMKPSYYQGFYFGKPCSFEDFYQSFIKPKINPQEK